MAPKKEPYRPTLAWEYVERVAADGTIEHGVRFTFGKHSDPMTYYSDVLWEDWTERPKPQRTAEMNERYDRAMGPKVRP